MANMEVLANCLPLSRLFHNRPRCRFTLVTSCHHFGQMASSWPDLEVEEAQVNEGSSCKAFSVPIADFDDSEQEV